MFMAIITRLLRSKLIVSLITFCALLYFIAVLLWNPSNELYTEGESGNLRRPQEFRWGSDDLLNDTGGIVTTCRNSIQGKLLLADDQGYVCHRAEQSPSGCCSIDAEAAEKYPCDTCNDHGCCVIYEYCVSCCLNPNKKMLLKRVLGLVSETSPLYASVSDHFELCLVKCRTSSASVQHETLYRDPKVKHCYGEGPPPIVSNEA